MGTFKLFFSSTFTHLLMQDLVDEAEDIMAGSDRKERKWLFKAINNGNHDDLSTFTVASKCSEQYSQRAVN